MSPTRGSQLHTDSLTLQQARPAGPPGTSLCDDARRRPDRLTDTPGQWNSRDSPTPYELRVVTRYTVVCTACRGDGGSRHLLQNTGDTATSGLGAALTRTGPTSSWSSDDNEESTAAVPHCARGGQVARQLTAAELTDSLSTPTTSDHYDHASVLEPRACTARALHDYADTPADTGVRGQVEPPVKASWPLHFREVLRSRTSHLGEWNLVRIRYDALVAELRTSRVTEDTRERPTPRVSAVVAARSTGSGGGTGSTDTATPLRGRSELSEYAEYSSNTAPVSTRRNTRTSPAGVDPTVDCGNCTSPTHYNRHSALKSHATVGTPYVDLSQNVLTGPAHSTTERP